MLDQEQERPMTNKLGDFTVKEGYIPNMLEIDYRNRMVKELLEKPRPKPSVPTHFNGKPISELSSSEKSEFYLSMQPASTQAILRRDPKDDVKLWERKTLNWKANPEAKSLDESVGKRTLDAQDVILHNSTKQRNQLGDSKESSVSPDKRNSGIWAFAYSKPADLSKEDTRKITKLTEMKSEKIDPPEKQSFWSRFFKKKTIENDFKPTLKLKGNYIVKIED